MKNLVKEYSVKGLFEKDINKLLKITNNDLAMFRRYAQRRLFGEPIEYIQKHTIFLNRKFIIDYKTYIPTKETESLINKVLENINNNSILLDVGTGCGALGISISLKKPNVKVYGCDISPDALKIARLNSKKHKVNIKFFESFYVDDLDIPMPTHIIADLPWGNVNYLLKGNDFNRYLHGPKIAFFHPLGILHSYIELFESIKRKGWHPKVYFESGVIPEEEVSKIIPKGKKWKYIKFKQNYSITIVYM